MIHLTGKAREAYFKWQREKCFPNWSEVVNESWFTDLSLGFKLAILVEWLDSVGIYIEVGATCQMKGLPDYFWNIQELNTLNGINADYHTTRQSATIKAVNKSIEIFNQEFEVYESASNK